MLKITSKIFRAKSNETFSALLKRVNKVIVNEKLIVVDYWKE